jgi:hypothetical protein
MLCTNNHYGIDVIYNVFRNHSNNLPIRTSLLSTLSRDSLYLSTFESLQGCPSRRLRRSSSLESPKRFGNHREGKLKSYYRSFVMRFICITYLEGLQYLVVLVLVYFLRFVEVFRAEFLLLLLKVLVVRGLTKMLIPCE